VAIGNVELVARIEKVVSLTNQFFGHANLAAAVSGCGGGGTTTVSSGTPPGT
jgi:hypothetical protein